jgi:hypothetical protein
LESLTLGLVPALFQRLYDHRSLHVAILSGRGCDHAERYGFNAGYAVMFF